MVSIIKELFSIGLTKKSMGASRNSLALSLSLMIPSHRQMLAASAQEKEE